MDHFIERVCVDGLHGRISFDIKLKPDLNIIYGKNGLGKTTLLHILANIGEGDLSRFKYLQFKRIIVENGEGAVLRLEHHRDGIVACMNDEPIPLNDHPTADHVPSTNDQTEAVRKAFGGRPCYLPAFRSVLERSSDVYAGNSEEIRSSGFDEIYKKERDLSQKEAQRNLRFSRDDLPKGTAIKTIRCRKWFGPFVPIIRYPAIVDVAEGLGEEWLIANYDTSRREKEQYEEAFVQIFETMLLDGGLPGEIEASDQTNILRKIDDLLQGARQLSVSQSVSQESSTYDRLVRAATGAGEAGTKYNSVLNLYFELLKARIDMRNQNFKPIVAFEESVNKFLDGKQLRIGIDPEQTSLSGVPGRERARIVPDEGKPYKLTDLSSGERHIATMLFAASRSNLTPGALLLDEPELSLHIDWQRHILKELRIQSPSRQVIACTHSPEVGADHRGNILLFNPSTFSGVVDSVSNQINDDNE